MRKLSVLLAIALISGAVIFGCAQQTSTTDTNVIDARTGTYSYFGTQSPGDTWSWMITSSTFIGTNETLEKYYSGTYTAYVSGFNKGVITATNDTAVPTDGSATAYFLEYPNTMLLVSPGGSNLIVCAASAATAPPAGLYNFINIPWPGWTTSSQSYGTVEVRESGGVYGFGALLYDLYGTPVGGTLESGFSFSNGRLIKAGNPLQIFMTPSGAFFGDNGVGSGGFAGAAKQTVDVTAAAAKQYRGVLLSYNTGTHHDLIQAIGAEPHPGLTNALRGFGFDNVETNTRQTGGVTLEFGAQQPNGIISGIMRYDDGTSDSFNMVIATLGGKYVVLGISVDQHGRPQNFLVVEK